MCSQTIYVYRFLRYINGKKRVLDQSNSKIWVQFVPKPGQKIPVAKELIKKGLVFVKKRGLSKKIAGTSKKMQLEAPRKEGLCPQLSQHLGASH
jgi:hypothetical protein